MDRDTIEHLKYACRMLGVPEEDLGVPREGLAAARAADPISAPSKDDVRRFVESVSRMSAGDSGVLPSWLANELTPRSGDGRRILMSKSSSERTGDCEWSQDVHEYSVGSGRYSQQNGQLLHKVPTGETGRWTVSDDCEIWLLANASLFLCICHVSNVGVYDSGTASSGVFNDSWTIHRYGKAMLQCEANGEFQFITEYLEEAKDSPATRNG